MTQHILRVDGYNVGDRLLEGVMFDVHIIEADGELTIDRVVAPTNEYTANIKTENFLDDIREQVQGNIDHLRGLTVTRGGTLADMLDEWQRDYPDAHRIDLLNEV